jgi:predicted nucleic acid-binding protein
VTVVVVDASVVVDLILDLPPHAPRLWQRLGTYTSWAAPHLLDAEVAHVLRNRVLRGKLSSVGALSALSDFVSLSIERFAHTALLERAFGLRDNATLYDALYLALAEALDAPLLTRDRTLAHIPGVEARVEVLV